jgi:ATP-dependent exoDNAse (exonuclease V) beta subunit
LLGRDGHCELRFASRKTLGFDAVDTEQEKRDEAEEIRLLYVAVTRAKERLVIPWFAEKGGRIDLLARGFLPVASALVEVPDLKFPEMPVVDTETHSVSVSDLITRRQAWVKSRAELLAGAAQPLARRSPSKLTVKKQTPEEEPVDGGRERAMDFGTVVHDALEKFDWKADPAQQREQIERFIGQTGLNDADKLRATDMVGGALGSELLVRARKAEQVYRELPFMQVTDEGLMDGKIDLLFYENGRWILVDYKTDARVEVEKYAGQLRAYEAALKQVAGITLAQKMLFFLVTGTVKQIP